MVILIRISRQKQGSENCVLQRCPGGEKKESTPLNMSNLIKHLRTQHNPEYTKFSKANDVPQQTTTQVFGKVRMK